MKIALLVLATFTALISAGLIVIFFLLPETSILGNLHGSGKNSGNALSVWFFFAVLLGGLIAGPAILLDTLKQDLSDVLQIFSVVAASLAGAIALTDIVVAGLSREEQIAHVMWLDLTILSLAILFLVSRHRRDKARRKLRNQ